MATKKPADFTTDVKEFVADAQTKAKGAFAKGSVLLNEAATLTKGNAEALVESTKIIAAGVQDLGKDYLAEGKDAFKTVKADVKELTSAKTPGEFVALQSKIVRRNVDEAFSIGAKNASAILKLFDKAFAPLSVRADLTVAKFKKAA